MKKRWTPLLSALCVGCLGTVVSSAPIGMGASGGANVPIAQQDAGSGFVYGVGLRIAAHHLIALEPVLVYFQQGDAEIEIDGQTVGLDGGRSTALGLNLIIGSVGKPAGMGFYGVVGFASHAMKQEGASDENRLAISFGPGMETRVGRDLALNIETRLHLISLKGGGARKNLCLSGGLLYYLGH